MTTVTYGRWTRDGLRIIRRQMPGGWRWIMVCHRDFVGEIGRLVAVEPWGERAARRRLLRAARHVMAGGAA